MICIKCQSEIKESDAYSKHTYKDGREVRWHYLCSLKESVKLLPISKSSAESLYNYLTQTNLDDGWILEVRAILERAL